MRPIFIHGESSEVIHVTTKNHNEIELQGKTMEFFKRKITKLDGDALQKVKELQGNLIRLIFASNWEVVRYGLQ